ncbi:MAG TPA: response regulator [Pseudomonadales bacterium]|nr:response regulator [Pseudomonadales bacterium]
MKTGRLLVIDDDTRHRGSVVGLLEDAGHLVVGQGSGVDAAALLDAVPDADLLLLDLNMPRVNGFDVLALVRTLAVPPAVIVLTAERGAQHLRRLLQLGAGDYLQKPYAPAELLKSITEALQRRGQATATAAVVERLRASDRLHRFLVEQSPDVIYTLDEEGRFTFLSASAEQVFGRGEEALVGQHWTTLFAPGEQELGRFRFDERRTGRRATRNMELRLAEGTFDTPRWVQVSATGLYGGDGSGDDDGETTSGRFEGTYGIVRDVTLARDQHDARTQLEAQLEQARRMEAIGQLAGGIAHDFNNILASMIGYTELAQVSLDAGPDDPAHEYLVEVVSAGQRARDLIAQLLNFSRPDLGSPKPVDLGEEIEAVTRMLRAVIPASIRIETDISALPGRVVLDPVQLQQVLLNLFINARDAVADTGTIRVQVRTCGELAPTVCAACGETFGGERVSITVADDGRGIPPEILGQLFDAMVTTRPTGHGTGFGLTLIEKIVHRHGGHLTVESARGAGTAFRLFLPLDQNPVEAGEPEPVAEAVPAAARSHEIVVVDDEVSVANFLRELLEHSGYTTTVFNDPETALDYLEAHAPQVSLVISDQTMPRLTGSELARRVAGLPQAPPVILCTGYGLDSALESKHIAAVLPKPFEIRELLHAVASRIGKG